MRRLYPEAYLRNDHARRLRLENAETETFSREEIGDRDGWICQLCHESIDRSLTYPDPFSASLDHRIPVSKGGSHTRENSQITHLRCNTSKGARATA